MSERELFGNSEQLESSYEKDHVADSGNMVGDTISRAEAIEAIKEDKIDLTDPNVVAVFKVTGDFEKVETQVMTCDRHIKILKDLPSAQPEIVQCKDCKHRPTGTDRDDLEFPDDKCPCKCEDYWYSWKPADDWYCGNGERKDSDSTPKLKPCPFCGGKSQLVEDKEQYKIFCLNPDCDCQYGWCADKEYIIKGWNRRDLWLSHPRELCTSNKTE